MKLIGVKRLLILAILLGINLAIAAVYFFQIDPMRDDAEKKLASVTSDISTTTSKIANIKADLVTFQKTLPQYKELEKRGFMLGQDRFKMSRDLDDVRTRAELAGFSFTIADIKKIKNADADQGQAQLIYSRIRIDNVVSLLDTNFYDFVDSMETEFPAHVRVQSVNIARKDPLDDKAVALIANGKTVNLITARAEFDWLTLVPIQQATGNQAQQGGL